jgi:hypothetical protein
MLRIPKQIELMGLDTGVAQSAAQDEAEIIKAEKEAI